MSKHFAENALARFMATAGDRLTQMSEVVSRLGSTPNPEELVTKLGRDLHTLKGESRLLGIGEIERLAHAGEDMLFAQPKNAPLSGDAVQVLYEAVDTIFACVQCRQEGQPPPNEDVDRVVAKLRASLTSAPPAPAARPSPSPAPTPAEPIADARGVDAKTLVVGLPLLHRVTDLVSGLSGALVRNRQYVAELSRSAEEMHELLRQEPDTARLRSVAEEQSTMLRELRDHHFRLDLSFSELVEKIREARLQPLRVLFMRYPSFVRQTARGLGKQVEVSVAGGEIAIDQEVLEALAEPCLHLVRNALGHGIESPAERKAAGKPESGRVRIEARHEGELIRIELADDGRGIDVEKVVERAIDLGTITREAADKLANDEKLRLIFTPGLSTAERVDELSGRGVGLDVVATALDQMGGTVNVESSPGHGTRFVLLAPVSLSLMRALLLETCDQLVAMPNAAVVEVFRLPVKAIKNVEGREVTEHRGQLLPLVRLREALGLAGIRDVFVNRVGVVVLRVGDETAGFIVDELYGEREIVMRPLGAFLGRIPMVSGVTLMENGDVVLVLHPPDLLRGVRETKKPRAGADRRRKADTGASRILYAEDSVITREYAAAVLRSRGYDVVEASDGREALALLERGERFNVLLTDLQMPNLDGFKLAAAVRKNPKLRSLPIVVLSTLDTAETKRMALDAGADSYLVKSAFSVDALLAAIRQVIR
jgi:chemotaxis protein histidine kinase CheA/ActR/RegA family two-component response regulator